MGKASWTKSLLYHFPERGLKLYRYDKNQQAKMKCLLYHFPERGLKRTGNSNTVNTGVSLLYHFPERGLKPAGWLGKLAVFSLLYHFPERGLKLSPITQQGFYLVRSPLPLPREGIETCHRFHPDSFSSQSVSFTTSPRGD